MSEEVVATVITETPVTVTEDQNTATLEEGAESSTASTEAETTKPDEPKPETEEQRKSKFQRRIERKNADLAAERMRSQMLQERLERLEAQARPQQQKDAGAPRLEQFDDFESYMQARDDYVAAMAEKRFEARVTKAQQEESEKKAKEAQSRVLSSWQDKQAAAEEKYADFEEVVGESKAPVTPPMWNAMMESDVGPDISYYLAKHPDEASRIAQLSPIRQIAEIVKLEAKVSEPPVKKVTEAPAPITPTGSKAKADKDPAQMTDAEFAAWRKRQIAQRA